MTTFTTSTNREPWGRTWRGHLLTPACVAMTLAAAPAAIAADDRPPAAFTPADISIGEPITLPGTPPQPREPEARQSAAQPTPATALPGSGWLGITVAESDVPGRWRIDAVTADGPAARAGIAVGDELRAVNGLALQSLEAASQAVTTIAAGQSVHLAVARGGQVRDVSVVADPRPATPAARGWQGAEHVAAPTSAFVPPQPRPQFQSQPATPPVAAQPQAADLLPPPGASAYAAAPQPFGAAGPATAPAPAAFAPAIPPAAAEPAPWRDQGGSPGRGRTALGVRTLPIDSGIQARFKLPDPSGAYVIGVVQDLPASKAGVPPGSVIVALDNQPVRSPADLTQLVTSGPVDRPITVQFVLPGGEAKRTDVVLQPLEVPLERALIGIPPTGGGDAPSLRTTERPVSADSALRLGDEIRALRTRLDALERRLQAVAPSR